MAKTYNLRITSGVVIAGNPVAAGAIVGDVDERLARRLLTAGKAELCDALGTQPEPDEVNPEAPVPGDGKKQSGGNAKSKKDDGE